VAEEIGLVQGKTPDSIGEWYIANSLWKLKHEFLFHYQVFTVTGVRGAYELDFLVLTTVPFSTPLEFMAKYWHSGELGREDQLRMERIMFELGPNINEEQIVWAGEAQTQEDADEVVRRKVGRA
jgi:hypothetical protein